MWPFTKAPQWGGRTLSEWVRRWKESPGGTIQDLQRLGAVPPLVELFVNQKSRDAEEALRQIGVKGVPELLRIWDGHAACFRPDRFSPCSMIEDVIRRILDRGPLPQSIIAEVSPLLLEAARSGTPERYRFAWWMLGQIGPPAKEAAPLLLRRAKELTFNERLFPLRGGNDEAPNALDALRAVARIGGSASEIVPIAIHWLEAEPWDWRGIWADQCQGMRRNGKQLISALWRARSEAAQVLEIVGAPGAASVPILCRRLTEVEEVNRLTHDHTLVRSFPDDCVSALASFGTAACSALPLLREHFVPGISLGNKPSIRRLGEAIAKIEGR